MRVAVIGAGIQGVGIALELALRGISVTLFDKAGACLTRASLRNEGKIHLGFVYAKDSTFATARRMIASALRFESSLKRWLDSKHLDLSRSSPFLYVVERNSLLDPDELDAYYRGVTGLVKEAASEPGASYFGADPCEPVSRLSDSEAERVIDPHNASAAFRTPELAIDPEVVAAMLIPRIEADPRITLRLNTAVSSASACDRCASVTFQSASDSLRTERFDHVVNASWDDLLRLDATAGVQPLGAWSFRVKHILRLRPPHALADPLSITIVQGPYGDVVAYDNGSLFLSWYPVGRVGWSDDLSPPDWCLNLPEPQSSLMRANTLEGLCGVLPALSCLAGDVVSSDVYGGIIFALGCTDVHDPASRLHERYSVGPRSFGRYHSVNTGKYTLAPLFAEQLTDRITGEA